MLSEIGVICEVLAGVSEDEVVPELLLVLLAVFNDAFSICISGSVLSEALLPELEPSAELLELAACIW